MKKIYIAPELVTVRINPISILCGSDSIPGGDSEENGNAETNEFKFSDIWDDDRKW